MKPPADVLSLLEYRMRAVAVGHLTLRKSMLWDESPSIQILFDGKQVVEGIALMYLRTRTRAPLQACAGGWSSTR